MEKRILVTGPNGFVGSHIMKAMPDAIPVPRLRGTETEVARAVEGADVIIHTAAISDMGVCERDPESSYRANVLLPLWIAKAAPRAKLILFSTDQVYNGTPGNGPFTEEETCPVNVYARHKLEMERRVLELRPDAVLLRATWMFSRDHGFVGNMRKASGPVTAPAQYRGLTWVEEVAANLPQTFRLPGGAYNFGSEAVLSMAEMTRETLRLLGREPTVTEGDARQPLWMNTARARQAGIRFSDSMDGIRACIAGLRQGE